MLTAKTYNKESLSMNLIDKMTDYMQLIKMRLSLLVVFSSVIGFLMGNSGAINWVKLWWLAIGGILVTGSANALNQLFEKDWDKLMARTMSRPLPANRMSTTEVSVIALVLGVSGAVVLTVFTNYVAAILAIISLILYAFVYTPMKRYSSLNVFVGAVSGALPLIIGWVAATGSVSTIAIMIFSIQFIWQFPHTWALAWKLDEQYKKAGMKMLPHGGQKSKKVAFQIMMYSLLLIPISLVPAKFGVTGLSASIVIFVCGLAFLYQSFKLFKTCSDKDALHLMLASVIYLPIVQLALVFGKL